MVSDKNNPGPNPGAGRRPPTIELTATEVGTARAEEPLAAEQGTGGTTQQAGGPDMHANPPPRGPRWTDRVRDVLRVERPWPLIAAAAGGAGLVIVTIALLWFSGVLSLFSGIDTERLARMESQIRDLSVRQPSVPGPVNASDIAARLSKIEAALAAPRSDSSLSAEVTTLRARIDEIASTAQAAQKRADAAEKSSQSNSAELARADVETLAGRVAALDRALSTIQSETSKREAQDDRASRLAVAATALRSAVERGDPFTAELAAAKATAADTAPLASLASFAASGIPSAETLARELSALIPAMLDASGASPQGGFLERLQANAERLVRVHPVGDAAGDDARSVVARIEAKASRRDIDGALADMSRLPAPARAVAASWIKSAESRNAALAASRQFARDALAALNKPAL